MAIDFGKKLQVAQGFQAPEQSVAVIASTGEAQQPASGFSFMSGQQAKQEIAQIQQQRAEQADKVWPTKRFFMKEGEERLVTFLGGDVDPKMGCMAISSYWEHSLFQGRSFLGNFICTMIHEKECPSCEQEEIDAARADSKYKKKNYFASYIPLINHTPFVGTKGTYVNTFMLLAAKPNSREQLEALAANYGGLKFKTFKITRSPGKTAAVGDNFMLQSECNQEQLIAYMVQTGTPLEEAQKRVIVPPIEEMVPYLSVAQIRAMGIGGQAPQQAGQPTGFNAPSLGVQTLESQLKKL